MKMTIVFLLLVFIAVFQLWWLKRSYASKLFVNTVNILCAVTIIFSSAVLFYPYYKNMTKPQDEKWTNKESMVSESDIIILMRVNELLENEDHWDRNRDRHCLIWEKKSLFCAIALAQKEIEGEYRHGSVPIQQVRFIIDKLHKKRWKIHPVMEFNNHKNTTFADVKKVLAESIIRIEQRLAEQHN